MSTDQTTIFYTWLGTHNHHTNESKKKKKNRKKTEFKETGKSDKYRQTKPDVHEFAYISWICWVFIVKIIQKKMNIE